jgi:hypothetical protein
VARLSGGNSLRSGINFFDTGFVMRSELPIDRAALVIVGATGHGVREMFERQHTRTGRSGHLSERTHAGVLLNT